MDEEGLLVRTGGKRDSRPLLLKLGFALALSIAGYFTLHFTLKPRPRLPPPKTSSADDGSKESAPRSSTIGAGGLKDELHILTNEEALAKIINGTSGISSTEREFLMPEFEPEKNTVEIVDKELMFKEKEEMEKEIAFLRNLVEALKERERSLEMQMIEYLGLKEQEATLRELESRLKMSAMESKLLNLKIESLQTDNQKLQTQASDYPRVVSELESAREEIQFLKKRLKVDGEQAKEKLAALHHRITEMLDRERKHGEDDGEVEKKLRRLKELEDEVTGLRKVNSRLAEENLKFVQLLESTNVAASSESALREMQALEEARHWREENEELKKEIEQLQTDRCADVEELVYLRWVNACLRYELRNFQPPSGKPVARDLSKCLSPESEKRAKQLILEYASSDTNKRNISLFDFDIDTVSSSSSQTSSEECRDTSIAASSTKNSSSRKSKLVSKIKKLVLGKDKKRSKLDSLDGTPTSCGNSTRRASVSPCSFDDMNVRRNSFESNSSCISVENTPVANHMESHPNDHRWQFKLAQSQRPPRSSLVVQRLRKLDLEVENGVSERCRSDLGTSHGHHMRMISEDFLSDVSHNRDCEGTNVPEKVKLKKFADVLKGSHGSLKSKSRLASFN